MIKFRSKTIGVPVSKNDIWVVNIRRLKEEDKKFMRGNEQISRDKHIVTKNILKENCIAGNSFSYITPPTKYIFALKSTVIAKKGEKTVTGELSFEYENFIRSIC